VGGTSLWDEIQSSVAINDGSFQVKLGAETPIPPSIFDGNQLWLGITVDGESLLPRTALVTVPYGFKSGEADHAVEADLADMANHATYADTATWTIGIGNITHVDTADFAFQADVANDANYAYFAYQADLAEHATHADTAQFALQSNVATNAIHADNADAANFAIETAFAEVAGHSDTSQFAWQSETASFAELSQNSNIANYAEESGLAGHAVRTDTAQFALQAETASFAELSQNSNIANYAEESGLAEHAARADTAQFAVTAATDEDWTLSGSDIYRLAGNVGIGTTDPDVTLQIGNGTHPLGGEAPDLRIDYDDNSAHGFEIQNNLGISTWFLNHLGDSWIGSQTTGKNLYLLAGNSLAMTLHGTSHNVGIGTENPSRLLHVFGYNNPRILVEAPSTEAPELNLKRGTTTHALYVNSGNDLVFYQSGDRVTITENGRVGIGTTDPQQALHVNGWVQLNMTWISAGYDVRWFNGVLYCYSSSRKYIDDIRPLDDNFDKILDAEPVSFTDKVSGERNIGFIAEEFEKLGLENLVVHRDGKPDAVKYELVSVYLLEMIKELKTENQELKRRIEAIETNR
jgi:hypothetical protein